MQDGNKQAASSPNSSTPFFARFLENQHGDAEAPAQAHVTMKYPSDRDEGDVGLHVTPEAEAAQAGPSRMTLKYPSDRDEIDNYSTPHGDAAAKAMAPPVTHKYPSDRDEYDTYSMPYGSVADARTEPGPSRMTLKYPSDRDEVDNHSAH